MTRQPSPSTRDSNNSTPPSSWAAFKDLARRQYEASNYEAALTSYTSALNPDLHCPGSEQQIILSNLVACRLKLGGAVQARAAIENSKQCIALNPNWAKGHVRLASAYIAVPGGGHSNDACNELQRALQLDPGNATAREMLLRELRRDHAAASSSPSTGGTGNATDANNNSNHRNYGTNENHNNDNDPSDMDHDPPTPPPTNNYNNSDQYDAMDNSLTWSERLAFHWGRAATWYSHQSDDAKTCFKIFLVLLVLYIGFGGRFGLFGGNTRSMGNYGSDNVYDQYRRYGTTTTTTTTKPHTKSSQSSYPYQDDDNNSNTYKRNYDSDISHGSRSSHRRTSQQQQQKQQQQHRHSDYQDDHQYYDDRSRRGGGGTNSNGWSSGFRPFDGGMQSMLLLAGLAFAGQRMGMNPFHTMMIVNALGGGRRRFRPRGGLGVGFGGMGQGGGMGGMGGFGRRRY